MSKRDRFYHRLGIVLTIIGSILFIAGVAHEFGFTLFSSSSLIVGAGVGVIGVTLLGSERRAKEKPDL